jgi:hypothetical protein
LGLRPAGECHPPQCAYDVLGIFGALQADGTARSASPYSGESLELHFRQGRPELTSLVLFRPNDGYMSCRASVYEDWCPNSNFFESREAASAWATARNLPGRVHHLAEAADLATGNWTDAALTSERGRGRARPSVVSPCSTPRTLRHP